MTAHVAMLSLESTSVMVGEKELAKIVGLLRSAIERDQRAVVPALVTAMSAEADLVRARLYSDRARPYSSQLARWASANR